MIKPTLFLLHFAGGNCFSYRFLQPFLSEFNVIALELPGRGRRYKEPLIYDLEQASTDIYKQLIDCLKSPKFLIFGHSMGALLALRVTAMLEEHNKFPMGIIVAGSAGPGMKNKNRHKLDSQELKCYLREMGGFQEAILDEDDLFNFLFPIIQADLMIAELNVRADFPLIKSPLYAIIGSDEKEVDKIQNWQSFSNEKVNTAILKGGHFFIYQWAEKIAEIIKQMAADSNIHNYNSTYNTLTIQNESNLKKGS